MRHKNWCELKIFDNEVNVSIIDDQEKVEILKIHPEVGYIVGNSAKMQKIVKQAKGTRISKKVQDFRGYSKI
jgi:hypothetical protein